MGDDTVLDCLVVEGVEEGSIAVAGSEGLAEVSHEGKELVGKIFVEEGLEAGGVEHVGEGAQAGFLFDEICRVTEGQQALEEGEADGYEEDDGQPVVFDTGRRRQGHLPRQPQRPSPLTVR